MRIRTFGKFFKEGVRNISRNRVMAFASIVAIMSALFILGVVLILVFNLEYIAGDIESKVEVTIFLDKSIKSTQTKAVLNQVENLDGVYGVDFISKEEGLSEWKKDLGEKGNLLDGYDGQSNPLPDKIILKVEKPEYVDGVISKVNAISEVDKVNYSQEVVDSIGKIVKTSRVVGLLLMVLLIAVAMVIINNTIKITVYSRRKEINIMKYIGATDSYIRWPYIIEGFTLGMFAAIFAGLLICGGYGILLNKSGLLSGGNSFLSLFKLLPMERIIYDIGLIFLLVGCGVGIMASILSTRKHLRV